MCAGFFCVSATACGACLVLDHVRGRVFKGAGGAVDVDKGLGWVVQRGTDDDTAAKGASTVGPRNIDVVRGDRALGGAVGGPVLGEARKGVARERKVVLKQRLLTY